MRTVNLSNQAQNQYRHPTGDPAGKERPRGRSSSKSPLSLLPRIRTGLRISKAEQEFSSLRYINQQGVPAASLSLLDGADRLGLYGLFCPLAFRRSRESLSMEI
jgi:hypothetical protein